MTTALKRAGDFCARYGGEEFAAIIPDTTESELHTIAEHIRKRLIESKIPHAFSDAAPYVTLSLGACCCRPDESVQPRALIEFTDKLLYQAKEQGRNMTLFDVFPMAH